MKNYRHIPVLSVVLLFALTTSSRPSERPTPPAQSNQSSSVVVPSVADIETNLSTNTPLTTQRLIETLEALRSQDLFYRCALVKVTEEERLKGQPKHDTFLKIVKELVSRGGGP